MNTHPILRCPNETGTWLDENLSAEILAGATEILGDYLASDRDGYAEAKAHRELLQLAQRCDEAIQKDCERLRTENEEMRDWYGRKRA